MLARLVGTILMLTLGSALLLGTLSYLLKQENTTDYAVPPPLAFTTESTKPVAVELAEVLSGKGTLTLGRFTKLRLDNDTALTIESADFDTHGLLTAATIQVEYGRVWLANNVWGTEIIIHDDLASATNRGGALIFNSQNISRAERATQVFAAGSPVEVSAVQNPALPPALLAPGELVALAPDTIGELAITDPLARQTTWQMLAATTDPANFEFFLQANQDLDVKFLNHLISQQRASKQITTTTGWLQQVRRQLTFLPSANAKLWQSEAIELLSSATAKPTASKWEQLANKLAEPNFAGRTALEAALIAELPYARLQTYAQLADDNLVVLNELAAVETRLTELTKTKPLTPALALEHELRLALALLDNHPNAALENLNRLAKSILTVEDLTTVEGTTLGSTLLAFFQQQPNTITLGLIDAYQQLNTFRTLEPFALATALADQITLVQLLIATDQRTIAPLTARELEQLLVIGEEYLTTEQLNRLMDISTDLSSRVAYLQTIGTKTKFHEGAYQIWAASQAVEAAKLAEETAAAAEVKTKTDEEPEPAEAEPQVADGTNPIEVIYNADDNKIARPSKLVEEINPNAIWDSNLLTTIYDPNDGKIARPLLDFTQEIEALN